MAEEHIPAMAVAVAKDGRIVWEEGFGWANVARQVPATPHTMFSVASVTKPMTATAVMRLVEQGRVHLDRPANDYLGDVKLGSGAWSPAGATVRRLLSHTAGLPFHYEWVYQGEGHRARTSSEVIARYGVLINPPGTTFLYSNLGYGVLGEIMARVSGRSYAEVMQAEVFGPLGMTHTVVSNGAGLGDTAATRYATEREPYPAYDLDTPAGGAVYTSAHDLTRFGMFHLGNRLTGQARILTDSTRRLMQRSATPASDEQYGLGWLIDDDHGVRRLYHDGDMPGVRARVNLYPDENLVVAVVTNQQTGAVDRVAEELAAALLPRYAAARRARAARTAEETAKSASGAPAVSQASYASRAGSPELLGEWTGQIATSEGTVPLTLRVQPDGDVHVQLGDELRTLLNEASFERGVLTGRFAGTIPTEDARRHPHHVLLTVRLRDGKLAGAATAQGDYFALSSFVELRKATGGE
jgi:CubicO group peptidase (beta-lactamase class C family)